MEAIKQKNDLLKERFTEVVKNQGAAQTNAQKVIEPSLEEKSDILQFWNPQDKMFDSGVIEAMLGLSNVGNLESLVSSGTKGLSKGTQPKTHSSKNVLESVFPEDRRQKIGFPSEVVQGKEKPSNSIRSHQQSRQYSGEVIMVTHRPNMANMVETASPMDLGSSRISSPMDLGNPMDAFLDITLKEEGEEQQESLQVVFMIIGWRIFIGSEQCLTS